MTPPDRIAEIEKRATELREKLLVIISWKHTRFGDEQDAARKAIKLVGDLLQALSASQARVKELESLYGLNTDREERPLAMAMLLKFRERLKENIADADELIDVVSIEDMGALLNVVFGKDAFNDGLEAAAKIAEEQAEFFRGAQSDDEATNGRIAARAAQSLMIANAIRAVKKGTP